MNNTEKNGMEKYLNVTKIRKSFHLGSHAVDVLKGVTLSARKGEWLALLGSSGSGKTTLLDIIGTISRPDSGKIEIGGTDVSRLGGNALVEFRRKKIGFVFQAYHILPELNILENAMLPGLLDGKPKKECMEKAEDLLRRLKLEHRLYHRPNELSGGEQQRAAIARALQNDPELILADEPTGNLDSVTGREILDIFSRLHESGSTTIVMVTHDPKVANLAERRIVLRDGSIATES